MMSGDTLDLIATTGFGVESVVARELKELGFEDAKPAETGRVRFRGPASAVAECNVRLRCADRVLIEIARFEATDFGRLFDETRSIAWEGFMPSDASILVKGRSVRSQLHGVPACQRLVKKAIVDRLLEKHRVSGLPESGPRFPIEISMLDDQASLTLDTSGRALHRRGYRPVSGRAPLKETLAAALLKLSFWRADRAFLDPFCGTGTLLNRGRMDRSRDRPWAAPRFRGRVLAVDER